LAVEPPPKEAVAMAVPFFSKVTEATKPGFPIPETERVSPVSVTEEPPGLLNWTCWTATLEAPGDGLELPGGLDPWVAVTAMAVGVKEAVAVAVQVKVAVFTGVRVGVEEGEAVAVGLGVKEGV
jgi:hypothetical protein